MSNKIVKRSEEIENVTVFNDNFLQSTSLDRNADTMPNATPFDRSSETHQEKEEDSIESEINEAMESYDYEKLRAEYDQEFSNANITANHTLDEDNKDEETVKDAIKKIVEFDMPRNCTKEELTEIGVRALECLAFDYQHSKNSSDVRRVLARTWSVVRIWLCIYIFIAIPCWFQKGM